MLCAVDIDEYRLKRVKENLIRLKQHAVVMYKETAHSLKNGRKIQFDRILLDAPCSRYRRYRRHPDIKWLRLIRI